MGWTAVENNAALIKGVFKVREISINQENGIDDCFSIAQRSEEWELSGRIDGSLDGGSGKRSEGDENTET